MTPLLDCEVGSEVRVRGALSPWTVMGFHTTGGDLWLERAVDGRREAATVTAKTAHLWERVPSLSLKIGDRVRVVRGWNPMAPVRTVVAVEGGAAELDCTPSNGVRITAATAHLWEKVDDAS